MKNAICVLANNIEYFNLFIQNYPKELKTSDFTLIVVNETRIGDKTEDIKRILAESDIPNYKVFTSRKICDEFKKKIIDNEFVEDYTMSMNILSLWFIKRHNRTIKKVLLLDDDVILRSGIAKLFETDHHLFKSNRLSAGMAEFEDQSRNAKNIYYEWFRIFNVKFSQEWWKEKYLKKYANSGQRLIVLDKLDLSRYEEKLKKFFESEIFFAAWCERNTHVSWYFDERFETFFFFDDLNNDLKDCTYLVLSKREKLTDASIRKMLCSSIIHNATNSHKRSVYNFMIENGVIEGEILND